MRLLAWEHDYSPDGGYRRTLIIGVAARVLAVIAGVLLYCVLKKRTTKEPHLDLIDMSKPTQPQQANDGSNVQLVQKLETETGSWDPVPTLHTHHRSSLWMDKDTL